VAELITVEWAIHLCYYITSQFNILSCWYFPNPNLQDTPMSAVCNYLVPSPLRSLSEGHVTCLQHEVPLHGHKQLI